MNPRASIPNQNKCSDLVLYRTPDTMSTPVTNHDRPYQYMPWPAGWQNMKKKEGIVPLGQTYRKSLENKE